MAELPPRSSDDDGLEEAYAMAAYQPAVSPELVRTALELAGGERPACPACDGYGYHDADGEPMCDVCEGTGVATPEQLAAWDEREREHLRRDPLQAWVIKLACESCGSPPGEPCQPTCAIRGWRP